MLKTHKKILIITSLIILLPIVAGLLLWNQLPDHLATHWGPDGNIDGWGSKPLAVFLSPLLLLATHWFCILVTAADPGNKNQNKKATGIVLWVCPILSLFSSAAIYGAALGAEFNMASVTFSMLGILFLVIGNYLPKVKPNYTIGIKVPWALHSEENWNATHRFAGKLWVFGGLALLLLAFFPAEQMFLPIIFVILVMAFVPMLYSWLYYKKQLKTGTVTISKAPTKEEKLNAAILKGSLIFVAVVFLLVGILLFSGHIDVVYEEASFTLEASFWNDLTVNYGDIESIEYRDGNVDGTRTWGLGSFRLLLGAFENEEFGSYTRYTYYQPEACVVLTVKGKTLVISGADAAETTAIYEALTARLEG